MTELDPNLVWSGGPGRSSGSHAPPPPLTLSVIVISFQVRDLLRECLQSVRQELDNLRSSGLGDSEILVVDNASSDASAEMVASEFPSVRLCRSKVNLGFGVANNVAIAEAHGRYIVLLNSDAFFTPGVLSKIVSRMNASPEVGIGGVLQINRDGSPQPSARRFHSVWRDAMIMTGLAERFPTSRLWARFFGGIDRRWKKAATPVDVDWLPGAFLIMSKTFLTKVGVFDPRFFLYLEEVDLCLRAHRAGFRVRFWPDLTVIHIGGESARAINDGQFASFKAHIVLWRMRSTLLYYRKWHGAEAALIAAWEIFLFSLRWVRNRWSPNPNRRLRAEEARALASLMRTAWRETNGGRVSPPHPW